MKLTKDEIKRGYPLLYAVDFNDNVEHIAEMLRDKEISIAVDYNRTPRRPSESPVVYRLSVTLKGLLK